MPDIHLLASRDWRTLRKIRLSALRESPHAFLATYLNEKTYDEGRWRAEFTRGDWYVGMESDVANQMVSLIGVTREPDTPAHQRFLEYLWVDPGFRRRGIASSMIRQVLDTLKQLGVRTVFLWVLDGNDGAASLYKRLGFASCNNRQPLAARPGRSEELMQLDLSPAS